MSSRLSHRFRVSLHRADAGAILSAPPRPDIVGGAPSEFGGTDQVWSPEHLLLSAVELCFLTTFDFHVRRAGLGRIDVDAETEGTVEKTTKGLAFTAIRLAVRLAVPAGQAARAEELAHTAERTCLISNSLACPVELVVEVRETLS